MDSDVSNKVRGAAGLIGGFLGLANTLLYGLRGSDPLAERVSEIKKELELGNRMMEHWRVLHDSYAHSYAEARKSEDVMWQAIARHEMTAMVFAIQHLEASLVGYEVELKKLEPEVEERRKARAQADADRLARDAALAKDVGVLRVEIEKLRGDQEKLIAENTRLSDAVSSAKGVLLHGLRYHEHDGHNLPKSIVRGALDALGVSEKEIG